MYPNFTAACKRFFIYSEISFESNYVNLFLSKTCFLKISCSNQDFPFDAKFNILGCNLSNMFAKIAYFVKVFLNSFHNIIYSIA